MPWVHCERTILDSDSLCPECGITKAEWTVEFDLTRAFQVRRRSFLIQLLDPKGEPVAGEPYEVELEGQDPIQGQLDDAGKGRHELPKGQTCLVTFPHRHEAEVEQRQADRDEGEAGADDEGEETETETETESETEEAGASYTVAYGDSLCQLAERNGLPSWRSIYFHPRNLDLRKVRRDPNRLYPGDTLWLPDPPEAASTDAQEQPADDDARYAAQFECDTGRRHVFNLLLPDCESGASIGGTEAATTIRLRDGRGQPVPGEPYVLEWSDGTVVKGELDGDGQARVRGRGHQTFFVVFPARHKLDVLSASERAHQTYVGANERATLSGGGEGDPAEEPHG